jgi:hypothetical protein
MQIISNEPLTDSDKAVLSKQQKGFWKEAIVAYLFFTGVGALINFGLYWIENEPTIWRRPGFVDILFLILIFYQYIYPIYTEKEKYKKDLDSGEKVVAEFVVRSKEKSFADKTFSVKTFEDEPFHYFNVTEAQYNALNIGSTFLVEYGFYSKMILRVRFE